LGKPFVIDTGPCRRQHWRAAAAKAKPDGYTILFTTPAPIALNKLMYRNMPYDPQADFEPVILIAKSPLIITAKAGGFSDLKEMIAFAKENPGKINLGHPGNGTLGHVTSELLQQMTGVKVTNIAYRGTAPVITICWARTSTSRSISCRLTCLDPRREAESHRRDVGRFAPASCRMSRPPAKPGCRNSRLARGMRSSFRRTRRMSAARHQCGRERMLASEKGKAILEQNGMQGVGGSAGDLTAFIASELDKWGPLIKAAKIEF